MTPQIAVTFDPDCGVDERKALLGCSALDAQAREFCDRHGLPQTPVLYYSSDVLMKLDGADLDAFTENSWLCTVSTTMDVPDALGFHDDIKGVIFARVLWQDEATWATLSHEVLEMILDPTADEYRPLGNGQQQALEACDRVEGDSYTETGSVGPDSAPFILSNYLLPAAFVSGSKGPWDRLARLTTWDGLTAGGYEIVVDATGATKDVYARLGRVGARAHETVTAKLQRPGTRLSRRIRGSWAP